MTIEEGNKLIAEFMGGKIAHFNISNEPHFRNLPHGRAILLEDLKYNNSWDWLMPVFEKIEKMGAWTDIWQNDDGYGVDVKYNEKYFNTTGKTKIESVWLAVVEFIKWHNVE